MSHNCRPNTKHTFDPDYGINVFATVPIGMFFLYIFCNFTKKFFFNNKNILLKISWNWNMNLVFWKYIYLAKGEVISASYTQSIWNTMNRRKHLKQSKCFWCSCARCQDPTEFGTYLSALNCSKCGGKVLSTDPLDENAPFR